LQLDAGSYKIVKIRREELRMVIRPDGWETKGSVFSRVIPNEKISWIGGSTKNPEDVVLRVNFEMNPYFQRGIIWRTQLQLELAKTTRYVYLEMGQRDLQWRDLLKEGLLVSYPFGPDNCALSMANALYDKIYLVKMQIEDASAPGRRGQLVSLYFTLQMWHPARPDIRDPSGNIVLDSVGELFNYNIR
jgi:hypothetical protein